MSTHPASTEVFASRRGVVTWCPGCGALHLEFGNALISFVSLLRMETFQSRLRTLFLQTEEGERGLIDLQDGPATGFTFSKGQMREMEYLIDGAAAMARRDPGLRKALGFPADS